MPIFLLSVFLCRRVKQAPTSLSHTDILRAHTVFGTAWQDLETLQAQIPMPAKSLRRLISARKRCVISHQDMEQHEAESG